jgi:hypothetical protein
MNTLLDAVASYASYLKAAGFEDVVKTRYKLPSGPWPKDKRMKLIRAFEMHNLLRGLSGMSLRMFSKGYGWGREEIEVFLVGVRKDIQNMSYHTYWNLYSLYLFSPLIFLFPHPLLSTRVFSNTGPVNSHHPLKNACETRAAANAGCCDIAS